MKISAKTKAKPTPVTVDYNVPDKLVDLAKLFGDEVVATAAKGAIVISLQSFLRRHIEKGTPSAELQAAVNAWKPDVRTITKQSAFEKAAGALDKLTPDERKALLAKLQGGK